MAAKHGLDHRITESARGHEPRILQCKPGPGEETVAKDQLAGEEGAKEILHHNEASVCLLDQVQGTAGNPCQLRWVPGSPEVDTPPNSDPLPPELSIHHTKNICHIFTSLSSIQRWPPTCDGLQLNSDGL